MKTKGGIKNWLGKKELTVELGLTRQHVYQLLGVKINPDIVCVTQGMSTSRMAWVGGLDVQNTQALTKAKLTHCEPRRKEAPNAE